MDDNARGNGSGAAHRLVKRELYPIHIFLIIMSGTIGMGLFHNSGEVLTIAGPGGALTAYAVAGIGVICVMEGIAEMIGHWPIANAMVEFVKAFVDKDLAIVVGIAYWYSYSISFAILIIAATNLAGFWVWSTTLQIILFIVLLPIFLVVINGLGVFWYGNVEAVLGAFKLLLVIVAFIAMCAINNKDVDANTPTGKIGGLYLDEGFQNNRIARSNGVAVVIAIPIVVYAYIGVEIVAVTALEAKNPMVSLKYPAKYIAWLTSFVYFFSALGFYLNVHWQDPLLPAILDRNETPNPLPGSSKVSKTSSILVIAVLNAHIPAFDSFLNICLIIAVLSASNTALYVASRTLFGLTREISPNGKGWWRKFSKLSTTSFKTKVPVFALLISAVTFCWVPFLHLRLSYSLNDLQSIMSGMATVAVVIVWGVLCLTFIRYRLWLRRFKDGHLRERPQYNHWTPDNENVPFTTTLAFMQPIPAVIGLIFCILTVFVFATARWWNGDARTVDALAAFIGPGFLFTLWLALKVSRWVRGDNFEWYVKLGSWQQLETQLDRLEAAIVTDAVVPEPAAEGNGVLEMNDIDNSNTRGHSSRGSASGTSLLEESNNSGHVTSRT